MSSKKPRTPKKPTTAEAATGGSSQGGNNPSGSTTYMSGFYQVIPGYVGNDGQTSTTPWLLPPTQINSQSIYGQQIEVDVSNVAGATAQPSGASCTLSPTSDFTLTWGTGLVAQVFIPAYVWNVAGTYRSQLQTNFASFAQALEALENNGCLMRGGANGVLQRVVEAMPLSLAETLYYRYNYNASSGYIDLQAGMRLRVEFSEYEFTTSSSPLNGFVGSGVAYYDVCGYLDQNGNPQLAFDSFLGSLRPATLLSPTSAIAGVIDLQGKGTARRYYRLFYPPNVSASSQGNTSLANNVTLIGAGSLADMATATTQYLSNQTCAYNGSNSVFCTVFRGRAIAVPEILVYLAAQTTGGTGAPQPTTNVPIYVPIGTTVRNLIERRFNYIFSPTAIDSRFSLLRQYRQMNSQASKPGPANYLTVQLIPYKAPPFLSGPDIYDLPLVKGDVLSFAS